MVHGCLFQKVVWVPPWTCSRRHLIRDGGFWSIPGTGSPSTDRTYRRRSGGDYTRTIGLPDRGAADPRSADGVRLVRTNGHVFACSSPNCLV